jgi:prolyl 4-hydroxylase
MTRALRSSYADGEQINGDPPVYLFEDYLSREQCTHLIELSEPHMRRAVVSGGAEGVESEGRTGSVHWIQHNLTPITQSVSQRLADLVGIPLENAESIQVINYGVGEQYKPHYDGWEHTTETGQRCLARGGQRLLTCLIYLSDVDNGGSTFFPRLDMEVMPKTGRMVLFHNCHENSNRRHELSLHGGMPLGEGVKWACNVWFRENSYAASQPDPFKPSSTTRRF